MARKLRGFKNLMLEAGLAPSVWSATDAHLDVDSIEVFGDT